MTSRRAAFHRIDQAIFAPAIPGTIIALVAGTAAAVLSGLPLETIGSRFGGIPSGLPEVEIPRFDAALIPILLRPAITVAMEKVGAHNICADIDAALRRARELNLEPAA